MQLLTAAIFHASLSFLDGRQWRFAWLVLVLLQARISGEKSTVSLRGYVLCEFVMKLHPEAESETVFSQDSFVCQGCFRKLEKLVKLRSEVGNLESELETNLKTAIQQRGLIFRTSSCHGASEGEGITKPSSCS